MKKFSHLFSPTYVGKMLVKNRVVMAPMLVGYSNLSGEVTESMVDYYEARARGGVGIIIVEAACVDNPTGKQSCRQTNLPGQDGSSTSGSLCNTMSNNKRGSPRIDY